jgi:hypothetical protein
MAPVEIAGKQVSVIKALAKIEWKANIGIHVQEPTVTLQLSQASVNAASFCEIAIAVEIFG